MTCGMFPKAHKTFVTYLRQNIALKLVLSTCEPDLKYWKTYVTLICMWLYKYL